MSSDHYIEDDESSWMQKQQDDAEYADNTLENIKGQVTGFVLAGYDKDGECFFSSTYYDAKEGLWLVEQFKQSLIRNAGVE